MLEIMIRNVVRPKLIIWQLTILLVMYGVLLVALKELVMVLVPIVTLVLQVTI
jgi:hypothetical protein